MKAHRRQKSRGSQGSPKASRTAENRTKDKADGRRSRTNSPELSFVIDLCNRTS